MGSFLDDVVGSFSTGAAGNPTVAMMEAAFAHHGLAWRYLNCEVSANDLAAAVDGARAMGWRGFNCSIPHKQAVIAHLDELGQSAKLCQADNCVVRTESGTESDRGAARWVGHNTDGVGFLRSLRVVTDPSGRNIMIIGSGGAAHAIAVELALAGAAKISITSRNEATARSLADLVNVASPDVGSVTGWASGRPLEVEGHVDVVVQATPVGMAPEVDQVIAVDWSSASY